QPHGAGSVRRERGWIVDERRALAHRIVLDVPSARTLPSEEAGPPLLEDLSLAVSLATDGVVAQDEPDRKDAPAGEAHVVAAARRQVDDGVRLLPAADLQSIVRRRF